ncbi:MAG: radical SAM protein [Desulfovibrio sp.]|nr:radical SAM protein [Desulfovibrio sp.]
MTTASRSRGARSVAVPWPAPASGPAIVPVFLPHFGCPRRCLFCGQEAQTGVAANAALRDLLAAARAGLEARIARGLGPTELAFYGGTFTALPEGALGACLDFSESARRDGLISAFRCSTRPDAVDGPVLERLAAAGCATVELGVQSFVDAALRLTARGYTGAQAGAACARVAASGMGLCVQLLPGMPGVTPTVFLDDVREALALGARALRFYPCLVLEGTGLAALWRAGAYAPWDMETTLETLAQGWLLAHQAGAAVLRMGVAPGEDLARALLAGPWHPALGSRVLGRALLRAVQELARGLGFPQPGTRVVLEAPAFTQGHFWGHAGELREHWAALGLGSGNVRFRPEPMMRLRFEGEVGAPSQAC